MQAAERPVFEDLLQRLATEHQREICELRAEIARLSQFHLDETGSPRSTKSGSPRGVNHVEGKLHYNEEPDMVVLDGATPRAPRPLPTPNGCDGFEKAAGESGEGQECNYNSDMNEENSHSTRPTASSDQPDEEALAAAFAVATDLSTDKEFMESEDVWPEDLLQTVEVWPDGSKKVVKAKTMQDGIHGTKTVHMDARPEGLTLWAHLLHHARHEIYMSELPSVHPKWSLEESTGFNLKNLIGGANTTKPSQALVTKSSTEVDKMSPTVAEHKERCMGIFFTFLCFMQRYLPTIPFNPSSKTRVMWDTCGAVLLIHDLLMAPVASFDYHDDIMGMPASYDTFMSRLDIVSATFWSADILMSFVTCYHTNAGLMENRMCPIAIHYLKTWFPIDSCIVTIDLGLIIIMGKSEGYLRVTKTVSRIMRVTRLLRFAKMSKHISELMARINSEYILQIIGLLRLLVVIIILNHYIACVWFLLTTIHHGKRTWAQEHLVEKGLTSLGYAYFSSLHWSLTQFTPASMEIFPENEYERMFNVVVIMFAFVFFSSFVSSITNAMTHIRNINAQAVARDTTIRRFFTEHNISHGLAARIWHFVRQKRVASIKKLRTEEVGIFQQLPIRIRDELQFEVYCPILSRHPMLRNWLSESPSAARKICKKGISDLNLDSGKELKIEGEAKKMLFVVTGTLEFHMIDAMEDDGTCILEAGQWCLEAALWAERAIIDGHFIAAPGGAQLVFLDAEVFRAAASEHFETMDMLVKYSGIFVERFRIAMQDATSIRDNLLFNAEEPLKDMAAEVTTTISRRSMVSYASQRSAAEESQTLMKHRERQDG